ncbi:MAG: type II secretion system F family protein [Actinomycetota bacterium]
MGARLMWAVAGMFVALGCAAGVLIIGMGIRGKPLTTSDDDDGPTEEGLFARLTVGMLALGAVGAVAAGGLVFLLTGWPVAAVAAGALAAWMIYSVERQDGPSELERTEAIATWTEMIRDNMAGAAGLEQAIISSARLAPIAIRPEIGRFVNRIEDSSLSDSLADLGDDLDHRSADLVIAALSNAARMESRDVGDLLARLSESIRSDVRMRLRIETSRSSIRTSARMVIGVTAFTVLFLFLFANDLLDAYDSLGGQVWMALVLCVFSLSAFLLRGLSDIEMPDRFIRREEADAES